jgi:hypothetical protein
VPIAPGSKKPGQFKRGEWQGLTAWQELSRRQPSKYELPIWESWPGHVGIGLVCGFAGLIAVDIDTDQPNILRALHAVLPYSPCGKRGQKGETLFFRGAPAIRPRAFNIGKERIIDLLAEGRQTVLPPTLHADTGEPYRWTREGRALDDVTPNGLPELPEDIEAKIEEALAPFGYKAPVPVSSHASVPSGAEPYWYDVNEQARQRLDDWVPAVGLLRLKRTGYGFKAVAHWRPSSKGRPLHDRDLNLSISSKGITDFGDGPKHYSPLDIVMAAQGGVTLDQARNWLAERLGLVDPEPMLLVPPPKIEHVESPDLPEAFTDATRYDDFGSGLKVPDFLATFIPQFSHGLVGEIATYIEGTAQCRLPGFAMMAALAFTAGLIGRKYVSPTGLGLNLYLVTLAPTASGKEHYLSRVKELAHAVGIKSVVGAEKFTSDAALERLLMRCPCTVIPIDEFGYLMQGINAKNASPHESKILGALLSLYSKSNGYYSGKERADEAAREIVKPCLTIYATGTPDTFYSALKSANLSDGFLNRLVVMPCKKQPRDHRPYRSTTPSRELVDRIRALYEASHLGKEAGNLLDAGQRDPNAVHVPYADAAAERYAERIQSWQREMLFENDSARNVFGRFFENTSKVATLLAIGRRFEGEVPEESKAPPTVDVCDLFLGAALVFRTTRELARDVGANMAGSTSEAAQKTLLRAIEDAGPNGIHFSKLLTKKGVPALDERLRESSVRFLEESGQIVPTAKGRRSGGIAKHYTARSQFPKPLLN